jgi:hypothetical protein
VRDGRSYVSDGPGHLLNFTANGLEAAGSELTLNGAGPVRVTARAACLLPDAAPTAVPNPDQPPFWTPEHARIAGSRDVTVRRSSTDRRPFSGSRLME